MSGSEVPPGRWTRVMLRVTAVQGAVRIRPAAVADGAVEPGPVVLVKPGEYLFVRQRGWRNAPRR
jgi:hypothetical protein